MSYTTVAKKFIERDYRLLRGLFESRVMTIHHAATLYFDDSLGAARKRVWKLKNARLVNGRARERTFDRSVLFLTRKGFEMLTREGRLIDYPAIGWPMMEKRTNVSPLTLQHELDVMSAKAAMTNAVKSKREYTVAEFSTWPRLFAFPSKTVSVHGYGKRIWMKPDAFIRIREEEDGFEPIEHRFYLELDRSTEAQQRLQAKAGAYSQHYRSGGFAKRFGAPAEAFEQFPFRVLFICRTEERRNNAAVAMLTRHPPILTMVWLTTFEEFCKNALDPIWIRPIDYRDATAGTPFDAHKPSDDPVYRRQVEREQFVAERVQKVRLFESI
jgi:hypothetical protein